jgi:hypothetical protein
LDGIPRKSALFPTESAILVNVGPPGAPVAYGFEPAFDQNVAPAFNM